MTEIYKPSANTQKHALISEQEYEAMYKRSLSDPNSFWSDMAKRLDWFKNPTIIKNTDFTGDVSIKWYEDGVLNACHNCVDRHLPAKQNHTALIWEGDNPAQDKIITYGQLKTEISRLANALKSLNVKKGDRVIIYMPMVPEAVYAMLACARIGAVHSVVFGGFSPESLKNRIEDCGAKIVITADEGVRGGKTVPMKNNVDEALKTLLLNSPLPLGGEGQGEGVPPSKPLTPTLSPEGRGGMTVLVLAHTGNQTGWDASRDIWWHELVDEQSADCPCEPMNAEDPLFILYTSGSTGKPKGALHTTGGYLVFVALTHELVFDYKQGEIYWCTADVGWVTGHSYIVYGPLANGATSLVFEGIPTYPDYSRFWQVIDKHKVNIFYTAPTALRSLLRAGDDPVKSTIRKSLRILGSVGEPINHEAWLWYYNVVGEGRCPVIDTWWQTETGGHMITPLACHTLKPGSASKPFFGVKPEIVDAEGNVLEGKSEGNLCIADSWPGQMRSVYGDHERFVQTYFSTFKGKYFTGDGARRDEDGYYWITGRVDDVINVSGHRLGTAEIESAINEHDGVAESAVVGFPHDIKGQGIYAYVTLLAGREPDDAMKTEIAKTVRRIIGPIATPDVIQWAPGLPKTRSGKIMRRILRKIAANEFDALGDISTLADPNVVDDLIENRKKA